MKTRVATEFIAEVPPEIGTTNLVMDLMGAVAKYRPEVSEVKGFLHRASIATEGRARTALRQIVDGSETFQSSLCDLEDGSTHKRNQDQTNRVVSFRKKS